MRNCERAKHGLAEAGAPGAHFDGRPVVVIGVVTGIILEANIKGEIGRHRDGQGAAIACHRRIDAIVLIVSEELRAATTANSGVWKEGFNLQRTGIHVVAGVGGIPQHLIECGAKPVAPGVPVVHGHLVSIFEGVEEHRGLRGGAIQDQWQGDGGHHPGEDAMWIDFHGCELVG